MYISGLSSEVQSDRDFFVIDPFGMGIGGELKLILLDRDLALDLDAVE